MQREMSLLSVIQSELSDVDWNLVKLCSTEQEAMRLCIRMSKVNRTQRDISELLGFKSQSSLNCILESDKAKRVRNMSRTMQVELQKLCGNRAVDQWAELYLKGMLNSQKTDAQKGIDALREQLDIAEKNLKAG